MASSWRITGSRSVPVCWASFTSSLKRVRAFDPPIRARSLDKVVMIGPQPVLTPPKMFSWGIRTSDKKTSLKWAAPVICTSGRTSMPGVFMSTKK